MGFFRRQVPPQVRVAQANSPCLAMGDFWGLAEEVDEFLLSSKYFSVQSVASDTLQPTGDHTDPTMVAGVSTRRKRCGDLCFFHQHFGIKARSSVPPCAFKEPGNARAGAQSQLWVLMKERRCLLSRTPGWGNSFRLDSGSQKSLLAPADSDLSSQDSGFTAGWC